MYVIFNLCASSGAVPQHSAYFGEGSDPIHMDYISCTGTEYSLTDCETRSSSRQSNHSEDVGVQCQPGEFHYYNVQKRGIIYLA